jgi:anti-anti-sigma factor
MDYPVQNIQISGIFDSRKGREIHEQIKNFMAADVKIFLLDFQNVKFMDSSGFGTLLSMLKTVQKAHGRLVICSLNEQIRMILELTNTISVFEVLPEPAAFMENFTQT